MARKRRARENNSFSRTPPTGRFRESPRVFETKRQGYDGDRAIFFSKISAHAEPFGLGRTQLYLDNAELANLEQPDVVGKKLPSVIMHEIENIGVACKGK